MRAMECPAPVAAAEIPLPPLLEIAVSSKLTMVPATADARTTPSYELLAIVLLVTVIRVLSVTLMPMPFPNSLTPSSVTLVDVPEALVGPTTIPYPGLLWMVEFCTNSRAPATDGWKINPNWLLLWISQFRTFSCAPFVKLTPASPLPAPLILRFRSVTTMPDPAILIPFVPDARIEATTPPPPSIVMLFVIVNVPYPPGSNASISPPAAV